MPETHSSTSRRTRVTEVSLVVGTGVAFVVMQGWLELHRGWFIGACLGFWILYLGWRVRREPGVLREWGFRRDTLPGATRPCVLFVGAATGLALGYRATVGFPPVPMHRWRSSGCTRCGGRYSSSSCRG